MCEGSQGISQLSALSVVGREGHCDLDEVAGGASFGRGRVMKHEGWLMDFVYPAYLHFRGRNHHRDILPGTGGDPGQQQPSGGARACGPAHIWGHFQAMLMGYFASSKGEQ